MSEYKLYTLNTKILPFVICIVIILSCISKENPKKYTSKIYQTSYSGDQLKLLIPNDNRASNKVTLEIFPEKTFQKYCIHPCSSCKVLFR